MNRDMPKLGPWKQGMNTLLHKNELPDDTLRASANFDITDKGMLKRRRGHTRVLAATVVPGTFWSGKNRTLYVASGSLWELVQTPGGTYAGQLVRTGVGNKPMAYTEVAGNIYWSNGVVSGRMDAQGGDWPWGVQGPVVNPKLVVGASGSLEPGTYQVAVTFIAANGEESGTPLATEAVVADQGGIILLDDIPQPTDPDATIRVYCSYVNGEGLYWVQDIPQGTPSFAITQTSNLATVLLQTQFGMAPPAGNVIEEHNGRIYIGRGKVLWMTSPLRYGLLKPMKDFIQFPADITVVKAVSDGLFVCADQTYWFSGIDTDNFRQRVVLPYGGVFGTGIDIPNLDAVAWFGDTGMVIGGLNGEVFNTLENRVAVSKYGSGSMFWREDRGIRAIVANLSESSISPYMVPDYVALETARGGDFN